MGNKDAEAGLKKFLTRLPVYSLVAFVTCFAVPETSWSQAVEADPPTRPIESLKGKSPALPDLTGVVSNLSWVRAAGKALFWDQTVGSDTVACATCHFRAGADPRITNQVNPGLLGGDSIFGASNGSGLMGSGQAAGRTSRSSPRTSRSASCPTRPTRTAPCCSTATTSRPRRGLSPATSSPARSCRSRRLGRPIPTNATRWSIPVFNVGGHGVRKVEPRNSPTAINAVFNHRNFWDGRANNVFNGAGVFGLRDTKKNASARLVVKQADGTLKLQALELKNASAASQAVGPPSASSRCPAPAAASPMSAASFWPSRRCNSRPSICWTACSAAKLRWATWWPHPRSA